MLINLFRFQPSNKFQRMNGSRVWLQVNINIGSRSLKIDVRKGQSIEQVVSQFIAQNSLSQQYNSIIVNMIKQQVKSKLAQQQAEKEQRQQRQYHYQPNKLAPPSTPPPLKTHDATSYHNESPDPATAKASQKSTTLIKGTHTKSQMMAEMLRIKEEVERKKEQELSRVRSRPAAEVFAEDSERRYDTVKQHYQSSQVMQKKTVKSAEVGASLAESKKTKICRKIEEQKGKLGTQSSVHHKTEQSELEESVLKEDITQLKGLLNKTTHMKKPTTIHKRSSPKKQQNHASFVNKKDQQKANHKSRQPLKSARHQPTQQVKLEQVYNKWKRMQQQRKTQQSLKKLSQTPRPKKIEKHHDSFFYQKGKSFLQEKNKKNEESFKRIYPFKRTNTSVTPEKVDVKAISERLHKEARSKSIKKMEIETQKILKIQAQKHTPQLKPDPIRQRIRQRDLQYDSAISQLIQQGKIHNPNRIQSKSPTTCRRVQVI